MKSSFFRLLGLSLFFFLALLWLDYQVVEASNPLIPFDPSKYPGFNPEILGNQQGSTGVVAVVQNVFKRLRGLLGPVLVFLIASFGIRLVLAGGNEEKVTAAGRNFFYVLVGTAFVVLSTRLSDIFFLYRDGTSFLSGQEQIQQAAGAFSSQLGIIIVFLRYVLGGIALFYVVKSGAAIIFNADEEQVDQEKTVFIYGFVGFILIMISEALVNVVFNVQTLKVPFGQLFTETSVNVGGGVSLLTNVTNLFLALMSGLFLFTLVIGGAMYVFTAGNEERGEKATKLIIGSLIGLVIAFSSYTIVAEFASGGRAIEELDTTPTPLNPVNTSAPPSGTTP